MLITLSFIIIVSVFATQDIKPLYKNEEWVSFFLYIALLSFGLIIAVLSDLKVPIPNPVDPIQKAIEFIFGLE